MSQYGRIVWWGFLAFCAALIGVGVGIGLFVRSATAQVLAQQEPITSVGQVAYISGTQPVGKMAAVLFAPGYSFQPSPWPMWQCSGWSPPAPLTTWQASVNPTGPCTTGIQGQGDMVGAIVHSPSIQSAVATRMGKGTIVYGVQYDNSTAPRPFKDGKSVQATFSLMVRSAGTGYGSNAQVIHYFSFTDMVRPRVSFWMGFPTFDPRGFPNYSMTDPETQMPIVFVPHGQPHYRWPYTWFQPYAFTATMAMVQAYAQQIGRFNPVFAGRFSDPAQIALGISGTQFETASWGSNWAFVGGTVQGAVLRRIP